MEMNNDFQQHSAGAIVIHQSPFEDLVTPQNAEPLDKAFIDRWVIPFYMAHPSQMRFQNAFAKVRHELNNSIIERLLGEFNWRPRGVGAVFAAIQNETRFIDQIGKLLLKSEVCFAGKRYALALATFGDEASISYLEKYLAYYLTRPDLHYDQSAVYAALMVLDEENGTKRHEVFKDIWDALVINHWHGDPNMQSETDYTKEELRAIKRMRVEKTDLENL